MIDEVAYVAGPFRAKNAWEVEQNIRRAEVIALHLWRAGVPTVCPHTNTRFFQGAAPDDVWLEGCLQILRRCDFVVLVPWWANSSGTKAAVKAAKAFRMPIFEAPVVDQEHFKLYRRLGNSSGDQTLLSYLSNWPSNLAGTQADVKGALVEAKRRLKT